MKPTRVEMIVEAADQCCALHMPDLDEECVNAHALLDRLKQVERRAAIAVMLLEKSVDEINGLCSVMRDFKTAGTDAAQLQAKGFVQRVEDFVWVEDE